MDHLLEFLGSQRDLPIGTIVYVGAGDGLALDMGRYAALAPQRMVLVEGDPETAVELERRVGHHPFVTVRAVAVAPSSGALRWHRYNLAAFNGAVDALPLKPYYPRLRAVEERELPAMAFADLLASLALGGPVQALNVLVMNVPGQEDALLASVPEERLIVIDTVILRGCREPMPPNRVSSEAAPRRLQRHSFRKKSVDTHAEPLWPVTLMRFDSVRYRLAQFERELAAARAAQLQREAQIAELEATQATLKSQARDAERRTAEHLQQVQQLTRAIEADAALLAERDAQLGDAALKRRALEETLRTQTLTTQSLQSQLAAAIDELASARTAHAEEIRVAGEASDRHIAAMDQQVRDLTAGQAQLVQLETAQHRVINLEQQVRQFESDQTRQAVRQQMLQDELHRAEGQIELIKSLLLGEAGL
jgi:hypothetical protein